MFKIELKKGVTFERPRMPSSIVTQREKTKTTEGGTERVGCKTTIIVRHVQS